VAAGDGPVSAARFLDVMASFPAGVTITTTVAEDGRWWGFTASAFCSVSADPPLVLVCLAKTAECYPTFMAARQVAIHVLHPGTESLAMKFATRGADKFTGSGFSLSGRGLPVLREAVAVLECSVFARYDGGDHTIVVGRVEDAILGQHDPVVYFRRDFHELPLPADGDITVVPEASD
jgi:flavin reductase ActVB